MAEYLLSKCEALSSYSSTTKKKKKDIHFIFKETKRLKVKEYKRCIMQTGTKRELEW
jgi:hypothetical protein